MNHSYDVQLCFICLLIFISKFQTNMLRNSTRLTHSHNLISEVLECDGLWDFHQDYNAAPNQKSTNSRSFYSWTGDLNMCIIFSCSTYLLPIIWNLYHSRNHGYSDLILAYASKPVLKFYLCEIKRWLRPTVGWNDFHNMKIVSYKVYMYFLSKITVSSSIWDLYHTLVYLPTIPYRGASHSTRLWRVKGNHAPDVQ